MLTPLLIHRRRRRERRFARSGSARLPGVGVSILAIVGVTLGLLLGGLGVGLARLSASLPSIDLLPLQLGPENTAWLAPTRLYDRSGLHLLLALENPAAPRRYLPLDPTAPEHLPESLGRAILAIYDPTFWQNPGFSVNDRPALAQRLANNLLLAGDRPGLLRDLRARLLGSRLVSRYGREQVLAWFINSADYGHLAYGADAASHLYFDKPASRLTSAEAILLAGLTEAPALNPLDAPLASKPLEKTVLDRMLANGLSTPDEARQVLLEAHHFRPVSAGDAPQALAPAFTALVIQELKAQLGSAQVERGGLSVITTLDFNLQAQAVCAAQAQISRLTGVTAASGATADPVCPAVDQLPDLPSPSPDNSSGLSTEVAILDPSTGQLLALYGNESHAPGSIVTPWIYLAGFSHGLSPASLTWDIPASLSPAFEALEGATATYGGPMRLRTALQKDALAPAAALLNQVGAETVWQPAAAFGLPPFGEIAGGDPAPFPFAGGQVTPLALAQAYGVFANQGTLAGQLLNGGSPSPAAWSVMRVDQPGSGTLWERPAPATRSIVSAPLAFLMNAVLADETQRSPALRLDRPSGLKLGRTMDGRDVWAAGYTPQRSVVVWMGASGAEALDPQWAGGLWRALLQTASAGLPPAGWAMPDGITRVSVCDPGGELPTPACPATAEELFLAGNEPHQPDTLYRTVAVNASNGLLATVFTPPAQVEIRSFINPPAMALDWARAARLPLAPEAYDDIRYQTASQEATFSSPPALSAVSGKVELRGTAGGDGFASFRIKAGQGLNPNSWLTVGSEQAQPVKDGLLAVWDTRGLADGLYALQLRVLDHQQGAQTAVIALTVDNTPPQVAVVYPSEGQAVQPRMDAVIFKADPRDALGISKLEWQIDGEPVGTTDRSPWLLPWKPTPGSHTLTVVATDLAGNRTASTQVHFTVAE